MLRLGFMLVVARFLTSHAAVAGPDINPLPVNLGGVIQEEPSLVVWGPADEILVSVFGRGTDNRLWWKTHSNKGWAEWAAIPQGTITSAPSCTALSPMRLMCVALGTDNQVWVANYIGNQWSWAKAGGSPSGAPSVAATGPGTFGIFIRDWNGSLAMSTFNDGWVAHANKLTSPPGCDGRWVPEGQTSPDDLYFNCFSTVTKNGPDGINHFALVYAAVFPDASWLSKLTGAGAPFSSGQYKYTFDWAMVAPRGETKFRPSPVWKSRQRLDLFVTGKDGALWTITYSGGWGAWHRLGGTLASGPACDSRQWKNPGRPVFCAARAPDGSVVYGKM